MKPRIALLGAGVMGEAIATHVIESGLVDRNSIAIVERLVARRDEVASRLGVSATEPQMALAEADAVILAVKPQDFESLAREAAGLLPQHSVAISIMAGTTVQSIRELLGHPRVVRAMPNTPAQIGAGVTVWYAPPEVDQEVRDNLVRPLLASLGAEYEVPAEKYVDMATAINGSGPAYVFLVLEALTDAAVQIGIPRPLAIQLVNGTVLGSTRFAAESGLHPAQLRNMVTSPAGTTAAGLFELESAAVRAAFARAVQAAYDRSKALGS